MIFYSTVHNRKHWHSTQYYIPTRYPLGLNPNNRCILMLFLHNKDLRPSLLHVSKTYFVLNFLILLQYTTLYSVIMSPSVPLDSDSLSDFPCFWIPWQFEEYWLGILWNTLKSSLSDIFLMLIMGLWVLGRKFIEVGATCIARYENGCYFLHYHWWC